ncbi:CBS domain-containing protein [Salmonella enterica]|nr:CBS domain-containing protein [Salmonella enterica]
MTAADVMTATPITVHEDTPIIEVVNLLLNLHISGLPVVNTEGKMIGIVTEGDLLRRSELGTGIKRPHWKAFFLNPGTLARDYIQSHALYAGEIMTASPLTVCPDMPLDGVISLMENHGIKRVPVVDDSDNLTGIITRADILKALRSMLHRNPNPGNYRNLRSEDESVRKEILDKINCQPWAPRNTVRITVTNGVVDIYGTILNENIRQALIILIEETTDCKHIRDHLIFIEPVTGLYITAGDEK